MKSMRKPVVSLALGYAVLVAAGAVAWGKSAWVKGCKDMGLPAENCMYCHTDKMPKKDTFKADQLNDRGKWLMDQKAAKKADAVDIAWLKDYPGGKEQK